LVYNVLWSDPIEEDAGASRNVFGVHQSPRGKMARSFGWNITESFCAKNGLDLVVRSHQSKKHGFGFDVMHDDTLIRVFSARDYENHGNDGAVLNIRHVDGEAGEGGALSLRPQLIRSMAKRGR